jgi:hypothetical protein
MHPTAERLAEKLGPRFYWLCRCEGFRVDSPDGRVGLVEAVMFRVRPDEPDALIVRAGMLGRKLVIVPIEDVENVLPRRQRVLLSRTLDLEGPDFLSAVCDRLRRLAAEGASGAALGVWSIPGQGA